MHAVHELLLPQSLSRAAALELCRRYLATRFRRWRLAQTFLPRQDRDGWIALLAWHRLGREIAAQASGFERRRGLEELTSELELALGERARTPVGIALSFAARRHELSEEFLRRPLLEWKRDESLATFETREALLAHARALAIPEARLYLQLTDAGSPRNEALVDALAVGLQLTHWLENFARELEHGRLRLPVDELVRGGVELAGLGAAEAQPALTRVLAAHVVWARSFYARGWELCSALGAWRGRHLAFVLRWNAAALAGLEARGCDVQRGPPPAGWVRLVACASTSLLSSHPPRLA
ncbi:MAG: hypothetical protein EXS08_05325 [Planctomycetes bacterium]|nr:hypothetical protein [Planctomycetota bacterium]